MNGSLLKPNPDFRPDPTRAVFIQGRIDQQLIDKLTPRIIELQNQSRKPITAYIDSLGGSINSSETIQRLLSASDQDSSKQCRLITVVTGRAASAAADLLAAGDYAIAYPESNIFFHGVRTLTDDPLTAQDASLLVESLRLTNDRFAMELAERSVSRLIFRYMSVRNSFDDYRKNENKTLTDLQAFIGLTSSKLSKPARNVVEMAIKRNSRYESLVSRVGKKGREHYKRDADFEAAILKAVIDFERKSNSDAEWTFEDGGLTQVHGDFLLIIEYLRLYEGKHLEALCDRWGGFFLSEEFQKELADTPEDEREAKRTARIKSVIRPVWLFFVALCHALQEGENELTAKDAFWLGLIDEVLGLHEELFPLRLVMEYVAPPKDPAALPPGGSTGETQKTDSHFTETESPQSS